MGLKPKTWKVLEMAIVEGVACGWQRAHKHVEDPSEEAIKQAIEQAVLTEIGEWFDVTEEPSDEAT